MNRTSPTLITLLVIFAIASSLVAQTQTTSQSPTHCSAYESIPLPAEANATPVPKVAPDCASYKSYRGIGRPVNYAEARACAWRERLAEKAGLGQNEKEPIAWVVGGPVILADLYFNGAGVTRNVPLAIRLACEGEGGMGQLVLDAIKKGYALADSHGPFEFCDYAASTFSMNFCVEYASEILDDKRSRYYESLKRSMTAEQKIAFERLLGAEKDYIDAHAGEVYQGGTIRDMRTMGSQKILNDLFHGEIVNFEAKRWPRLADIQIKRAESLLNEQYSKTQSSVKKHTKEEIEDGEITPAQLTKAEDAWKIYHDAWVTFAHLRYPSAEAAIRAQIELDRYRLLKTI